MTRKMEEITTERVVDVAGCTHTQRKGFSKKCGGDSVPFLVAEIREARTRKIAAGKERE